MTQISNKPISSGLFTGSWASTSNTHGPKFTFYRVFFNFCVNGCLFFSQTYVLVSNFVFRLLGFFIANNLNCLLFRLFLRQLPQSQFLRILCHLQLEHTFFNQYSHLRLQVPLALLIIGQPFLRLFDSLFSDFFFFKHLLSFQSFRITLASFCLFLRRSLGLSNKLHATFLRPLYVYPTHDTIKRTHKMVPDIILY